MVATVEGVWEELHERLARFVRRRVDDEQSAEDIVQDVFLKIHARLATLEDETRLHAWVYQIARNAIADHYRARRTLEPLPATLASPGDEGDDVARDLLPTVGVLVNALPPDAREALLLTEYQGLNQRELAERLGLSFSGAKSRVQRARGKLRELLLACCQFELDRQGRIVAYQPHGACCGDPQRPPTAAASFCAEPRLPG
ncbi:MAG TPA: RNA polymerase sigma factor SigZ [Thermomicrobiales bacterium]|nr:RNA polymerase sigma factor SigZ [Thermomicrobiales bacterium]